MHRFSLQHCLLTSAITDRKISQSSTELWKLTITHSPREVLPYIPAAEESRGVGTMTTERGFGGAKQPCDSAVRGKVSLITHLSSAFIYSFTHLFIYLPIYLFQ